MGVSKAKRGARSPRAALCDCLWLQETCSAVVEALIQLKHRRVLSLPLSGEKEQTVFSHLLNSWLKVVIINPNTFFFCLFVCLAAQLCRGVFSLAASNMSLQPPRTTVIKIRIIPHAWMSHWRAARTFSGLLWMQTSEWEDLAICLESSVFFQRVLRLLLQPNLRLCAVSVCCDWQWIHDATAWREASGAAEMKGKPFQGKTRQKCHSNWLRFQQGKKSFCRSL